MPMVRISQSLRIFAAGILCMLANEAKAAEPADTVRTLDSKYYRESLFPEKTRTLAFSHFTWGAEAGASLDLTSHDLSTFDVDVLLGYKNSFIKMAGIGAGIHRSIHTGNNMIPVYGVIRTNFMRRPTPLFFNLQAGYSFNTFNNSGTAGDFYGAVGLGVNLQETRLAKSYIILSCAYQYLSEENKIKSDIDTHYIFFAKLVIGVNF